MKTNYEQLFEELTELLECGDTEIAHINADQCLMQIALSTTLSEDERENLVHLYEQVNKWYA